MQQKTALGLLLAIMAYPALAVVEAVPYLSTFDKDMLQKADMADIGRSIAMKDAQKGIGEVIKQYGVGKAQADTAIAGRQIQSMTTQKITEIAENFKQGSGMCNLVSDSNNVNAFNTISDSAINDSIQSTVVNALSYEPILNRQRRNYRNNVNTFCSQQKVLLGLCNVAASGDLPDGDIDSSMLFGSEDSSTVPSENSPITTAVIQHLTGVTYAPTATFGASCNDNQACIDKIALGNLSKDEQLYENLRRRYASVLGLATAGLASATESHRFQEYEIYDLDNELKQTNQPKVFGSITLSDDVSDESGSDSKEVEPQVGPIRMNDADGRFPLQTRARVNNTVNPNRVHPINKQVRAHKGADITVPSGTPVLVVADGVVDRTGYQYNPTERSGAGYFIVVRHKDVETKYFHLQKDGILVKKGMIVKAGQTIGLSGSTGGSSGPHLHYEVWEPARKVYKDFRQSTFPDGYAGYKGNSTANANGNTSTNSSADSTTDNAGQGK